MSTTTMTNGQRSEAKFGLVVSTKARKHASSGQLILSQTVRRCRDPGALWRLVS